MIYVTADPHFYHENIIKYTNRPFSAFREMNAVMTENWNQSVGDDDEVYILGDLTMREGDVVEQLLEICTAGSISFAGTTITMQRIIAGSHWNGSRITMS